MPSADAMNESESARNDLKNGLDDATQIRKEKFRLRDAVTQVMKMQKERDSDAHQTLRSYLGNVHGQGNNSLRSMRVMEHPPNTGVIYVMDRASRKGWTPMDESWGNFGQGAPEVGHIPNAPDKPRTISMQDDEFEYAPTAGIKPLREAVAKLYNESYRKGKNSQYTWENVCIVPGGRAGLTRIAAAIGDTNVGFFLPDYTAYEQLLTIFKRFVPIPTPLRTQDFHIPPHYLRQEITERGLGVVVCSNPANPTGQVVCGPALKEWIAIARECKTVLVMDEFYSHYIYGNHKNELGKTVSAAEFIEDVNKDPVIMLNGLTKNWRLPGWRCCWIVGPKDFISSMSSAGSFLDGGTNHPLQVAAIPLLDPQRVLHDAKALQTHFLTKRNYVISRLGKMNLPVLPPKGTFYIWLDVSPLPEPLNNGLGFFEKALDYKVIIVPGIFFDINPGRRRELFESPFHHYVRLSFGPPMEQLEKGLDGIEQMLRDIGWLVTGDMPAEEKGDRGHGGDA
ncbi:aminotransferase [Gaertneriomyces semiglobifer]|nr:aminotransferase [Gaertneriomyces semiglobifer]